VILHLRVGHVTYVNTPCHTHERVLSRRDLSHRDRPLTSRACVLHACVHVSSMYVCMYVCLYEGLYVFLLVCLYVCTYLCIYTEQRRAMLGGGVSYFLQTSWKSCMIRYTTMRNDIMPRIRKRTCVCMSCGGQCMCDEWFRFVYWIISSLELERAPVYVYEFVTLSHLYHA